MIRGILALVLFIAFLPVIAADSYEIQVDEDNTAIVTAVIEGSGLHTLELPSDAVPEVKGALYLKKGNALEMSIGSVEKATVAYTTKEYTKNSTLVFYPNNASSKVILPKDAEIISISPESSAIDAKSFEFKDIEKIEIIYSLPEKKGDFSGFFYYALAALAVIAIFIVIFSFRKRIKK